MIEILTPVGRLVGGHPMKQHPVTDTRTGVVKLQKDGITPRTSTYVGLAIPKGAETDWRQTEWGAQIDAEAKTSWPAGEYRSPVFAWKVTDGDSTIPNKKGVAPCSREGYPGHWVINASTEFAPPQCYHTGRYAPHEMIKQAEAIKPGDYLRMYITVKGNNPSETPGVYINPTLVELVRAGVEIVLSSGPDAATAFGGSAPALPPGAMIDPNQTTPPPAGMPPAGVPAPAAVATPAPPVAPHTGFVTGAVHQMTEKAGGATYEAMIAAGWKDETLIQHGYMLP